MGKLWAQKFEFPSTSGSMLSKVIKMAKCSFGVKSTRVNRRQVIEYWQQADCSNNCPVHSTVISCLICSFAAKARQMTGRERERERASQYTSEW